MARANDSSAAQKKENAPTSSPLRILVVRVLEQCFPRLEGHNVSYQPITIMITFKRGKAPKATRQSSIKELMRSDGRPPRALPSSEKAFCQHNMIKNTLTSTSRVVSRTRFCTTCCVALAPTRPPFPGPVTGNSGRRLFLGSILSLSRFLFVPRPGSKSRNMGNACGVRMVGAAIASDTSSIVTFLGGPLLSSSFAPFKDVTGE